ncbi:hypothetical protein BA177_05265 [Woeseia oceani]|uniref:Uncharacterized protein n=1 Tax=Woeseia oceani TaxID=1548547 RepID=A0A193LE27_9GAMM|nr:hypothetical protein BA177_05265 [Woeseia oceani]
MATEKRIGRGRGIVIHDYECFCEDRIPQSSVLRVFPLMLACLFWFGGHTGVSMDVINNEVPIL